MLDYDAVAQTLKNRREERFMRAREQGSWRKSIQTMGVKDEKWSEKECWGKDRGQCVLGRGRVAYTKLQRQGRTTGVREVKCKQDKGGAVEKAPQGGQCHLICSLLPVSALPPKPYRTFRTPGLLDRTGFLSA